MTHRDDARPPVDGTLETDRAGRRIAGGHMHAVALCLERTDGEEQMAFNPPIECPICRDVLELDRTLEDHLVGAHTHDEVARYLASLRNRAKMEPVSD
ncbi:hypothetical protein [Natrinema sp. H-ect4]|uniref:hypothetical protein n=1 Tax=Natrinema sp. H-ect4 TaxID=3242699 RepID=UPI0035A83094